MPAVRSRIIFSVPVGNYWYFLRIRVSVNLNSGVKSGRPITYGTYISESNEIIVLQLGTCGNHLRFYFSGTGRDPAGSRNGLKMRQKIPIQENFFLRNIVYRTMRACGYR
jgi:hypothetical protein